MAGDSTSRPTSNPANAKATRKSRRHTVAPAEILEPRLVLHAPELAALADVTLLAGAPLHVALDATDSHGDGLTYEVTSDNPNVVPVLSSTTNRYWQINVRNFGTMTFQLFEDLAPDVTNRIITLTNDHFYDGLTFHRIINNFMIQGGDPAGTGGGGSDLGNFDDEFNLDLQHTSSGLLSFAKSSDDTNNSQFFITDVPTRHLDFNHSIFGFLVSGDSVRDQINATPTTTGDRPVTPVVIDSARIIENHEDGVLRLKTTSASVTGTANITVRVRNAEGDSTTRTFKVTVQPDTNNAPPFIGDITAPIVIGPDRQTIHIPIKAYDSEGDTPNFLIISGDPSQVKVEVDNTSPTMNGNVATANVTISAINNTVGGIFELFVNVQQKVGGSQQNSDLQRIPLIVTPLAPTLELVGEDTGAAGDGVTKDTTLEFNVKNVMELAEITLWDGDKVIGKFTAGKDADLEFNETTTQRITVTGPLAEGPHVFSVTQLVRKAEPIVNYRNVATPESPHSASINAWVYTTNPTLDLPTQAAIVAPGAPFEFNAQSDREGVPGTVYSLVRGPVGMAINPSTGLIQWTPLAGTFGAQQVAVRVTDGAGNINEKSFEVRVNRPPTFDTISRPAIGEGATESFTISANDPDVGSGDTLTYTLVGLVPEGAAVDAQSGLFTWTPTERQGGQTYTFTVRVVDAGNQEATTDFTIRVDETNIAPTFRPIEDQFVAAGATVTLTLIADDADIPANSVTYSLKSGAPAGATINSSTGAFKFDVPQDPGQLEYSVTVVANDGKGGQTEATFLVVVNVAPAFPDIDDQDASENSPFEFNAAAHDDNASDVLTYELVEGPATATIDPATGHISWVPSETDGGTNVRFTVRATDRGHLQASASFLVNVAEVDDAPIFDPVDALHRISLNDTFTLQLSALDPDTPASALIFSLVDPPEGASIDPTTGMFHYTPPVGTAAGRMTIRVRAAEDDGLAVETSFDVILNAAPELQPIDDTDVDERTPLTLDVVASDANLAAGDDSLTFELETGPEGMTIDAATGRIEWTPTEAQGPAVHQVRVRVTDLGGLTAVREFQITVNEVANAPDLEAVPDQSAAEGEELTLTLVGSDGDPDGATLVYSVVSGPDGATIDPDTGALSWTPGENDGGASQEFTVRVTDVTGRSSERTFSVQVAEVNQAPLLGELAAQKLREGALLEIAAAATDADLPAGALTYSLQSAPSGMTIDPVSGVIRWTPGALQGGRSYEVAVTATDEGGLSDTKTLRVNVLDAAQALRIISPGTIVLSTGQTLSMPLQFEDPNEGTAGSPTFSFVDAPDGAVIDPVTGFITFDPSAGAPVGSLPFTVAAQIGGPEGPLTVETFFVQVGGLDALPALADAYEDLDSFLPGTTPSGPQSTVELLQRGATPAGLAFLPAGASPSATVSNVPRFTGMAYQVDTNVNLIHRPQLDSQTNGNGNATPAAATGSDKSADQAERREDQAPLGARTRPTNVRPTSRQTTTDAPQPPKTASDTARDKVVAEFDRVSDLKPASNRLAWYTSTNTTVPRPVLVWTAERGQVKATNGQLLTSEQVIEVPQSPLQPARPVSVGESYSKGTPAPEEAARDEAVQQAATEAPAPAPRSATKVAAVASAALFMPMLVSDLRDREEEKGWRRWLRGG